MKFYQLVEKDGERRAVYSKDDLQYMLNRQWRIVVLDRRPLASPDEIEVPVFMKRKPGRPKGMRNGNR